MFFNHPSPATSPMRAGRSQSQPPQSKVRATSSASQSNSKKPLKRTRSGSAQIKGTEIQLAHKKRTARSRSKVFCAVRHGNIELTFIFVGNLDPTVTEKDLETIFSPCGEIRNIQIRCSRGRGISIGVHIPAQGRKSPDFQYATVQFTKPNAILAAVELNGTVLKGRNLAVSVSPLDLPESRALGFRSKPRDPQAPKESSSAPKAGSSAPKPGAGGCVAESNTQATGTEMVEKPGPSKKKAKKRVVFSRQGGKGGE